jgi:DNA polymerase III delta subunit
MKLYADRFIATTTLPRAVIFFGPDTAVADYCIDQALNKLRRTEKNLDIKRLSAAEAAENLGMAREHLDGGGLFRQGAAVLIIDEVTDRLLNTFEPLLAEISDGACLILRGPNLKTTSKWVKYAETAGQAFYAVGCYELDASLIRTYVQERCREEGVTIDAGAEAALMAQATDFTLFTSFLDRLFLYIGDHKRIDEAAIHMCQIPTITRLNTWVEAILNRNLLLGTTGLQTLVAEDPMLCLRALLNQLLRLQQAHELVALGEPLTDALLMKLKPPVFAKQAVQFRKWLATWSPTQLDAAIAAVYRAERAFKMGEPFVVTTHHVLTVMKKAA